MVNGQGRHTRGSILELHNVRYGWKINLSWSGTDELLPRLSRQVTSLTLSLQSTVLKQMKLIHHGGYNESEHESYREIIFSNTIQSIQSVVKSMAWSLYSLTFFRLEQSLKPCPSLTLPLTSKRCMPCYHPHFLLKRSRYFASWRCWHYPVFKFVAVLVGCLYPGSFPLFSWECGKSVI